MLYVPLFTQSRAFVISCMKEHLGWDSYGPELVEKHSFKVFRVEMNDKRNGSGFKYVLRFGGAE